MRFQMKKAFLLTGFIGILTFGRGEAVSLTLAESVSMALASHEQIESAEAARDAAKWNFSAARRATGPSLQWQGKGTRIGGESYASQRNYYDNGITRDPYDRAFTNYVSLTMPIYTGGKLEGNIEAGRYGLSAADLTLENTRQEVRFQAQQAYFNLLQQKNVRDVSRSAVDMAKEQLNLITIQFEEGAVAQADVFQMEVELANYEQNLVSAQGNLQVAEHTLARVVGLPQDTAIETADDLKYSAFPYTLPECEEYAVRHRPDGAAALYRIKQSEARKDAVKAGYRPSVQGIVDATRASNSPFKNNRQDIWEAGIQVNWNIFDNAVTQANVNNAAAQVESAEAEAEKTLKTIHLETMNAYTRMKAAEQNIQSTDAAVRIAEDSYLIARVRYEEGVDILLTVTNAQEKLTRARSNYYTALYQYNLYRAELEKAIGVPVQMDVPTYVASVARGDSAEKALEEAAAVPVTEYETSDMEVNQHGE